MDLFEPVVRSRLYENIVHQISNMILLGQVSPGDQLPTESQMAQQFGVSRTVVREAVKALGARGLIDAVPGKGTFLAQPAAKKIARDLQLMLTLEDYCMEDLMVMRRILEIPTAGLAAENVCEATLDALTNDVDRMREALGDGSDVDVAGFVEWDGLFHADLGRATQNKVLRVYLPPVVLMQQTAREMVVRVPDVAMRAYGFHERILRAVRNRDREAATAAMREHLDQVSDDLKLVQKWTPMRT